MNKIWTTLLALGLGQASLASAASFPAVWSATQAGRYARAPEYQTGFAEFFSSGVNLLAESADRTLTDESDILPRFQKLVHPIGICFAGTWSITAASPYTGYFAKGAQGLIIVRASEAMGNPRHDSYRSFGFAGKIFPTTNPNDQTNYKTANFFTVDDLGGAEAVSYLDDGKLNEPKTSIHLSQLAIFPTLTEIAKTFSLADSNPGIRQVYEIGELGLQDPSTARSPHWMMIKAETTQRVRADDFRDELRLANYPNGLTFGVYVAEEGAGSWQRLGSIHLDQESLSDGCDHSLHFHHPQWK